MFTGIITAKGQITQITQSARNADQTLQISAPFDCQMIDIGASIACSGVCLTVIRRDKTWFEVQASAQTQAHTTIGAWQIGHQVNLERSLKLGDELGGHFVSGHVDGIAKIENIEQVQGSHRLEISTPAELSRFIAKKGSVVLDGVSLTVNEVIKNKFSTNIIHHTGAQTTLGGAQIGQQLNIEIDMLARYVSRLIDGPVTQGNKE